MASVLVVTSDLHAAGTLRKLLEKAGHHVVCSDTLAAARRAAAGDGVGAIVLSPTLTDGSGLELIPELRRQLPRAPILVIDDDDGMAATLVAMREGAFDCLPSPVDPRRLLQRLEDALKLTPAQAIAVAEVPEDARAPALVGRSPAMREVFKKLGLLAASRATVFLRGESGTGKELAARVLHDYGLSGGQAPFVAVHCAALPRPLVEAEIFGHRKGAFTGADRDKPGKLELAAEGTLFLDEVGEIPLETQVKLLRVLQERQFERLGDNQPRPFNARVLAATHRDLEELVREGTFREDLYYRLNVATVTLPPLRERREDIPLIASRLLSVVTREVGRRIDGLSVNALEKLCVAEWPGNVRELRNVLTRAVVRCRGRLVDEDDIDLGADAAAREGDVRPPDRFPTLDEAEREHVRRALELAKGHRGRACSLLGVSRPTLLRKMRKYGLLEGGDEELERPVTPPRSDGTRRAKRPT
ncbi:MAG: sigma-54 dependent transcriptional regulator [Planctomycetes bacterium]|nr:sigma-54 dependent transcriptional regulator [Planctomycetota bacterium]